MIHFSWGFGAASLLVAAFLLSSSLYSYEVTAKVTAYCPGRQSDGTTLRDRTKGGTPTASYGAATCNNTIPLGSTITIPELGSFIVDDACGAARKLYRNHGIIQIDLRLSDYQTAMNWGVKYIRIRIDPKLKVKQ